MCWMWSWLRGVFRLPVRRRLTRDRSTVIPSASSLFDVFVMFIRKFSLLENCIAFASCYFFLILKCFFLNKNYSKIKEIVTSMRKNLDQTKERHLTLSSTQAFLRGECKFSISRKNFNK